MYNNTQEVLALQTPVAVAVLPATSGNTLFQYAAIAAIVIGSAAIVMQVAAIAYRLSARKK